MFAVNKNPTRHDLKRFGWAMLAGFLFLAVVVWYVSCRGAVPQRKPWVWIGSTGQVVTVSLAALGVMLWLVSIGSARLAKPLYVAWMSVTVPVGVAMSTLLLTLLFLLVVPIFALIVRVGDPLGKRLKAEGTYWRDFKTHEATLERMRRPF